MKAYGIKVNEWRANEDGYGPANRRVIARTKAKRSQKKRARREAKSIIQTEVSLLRDSEIHYKWATVQSILNAL